MKSRRHQNLESLIAVASKLDELRHDIIFLGGCVITLLVDKTIPDVRYTLDVDCIIDVFSLNDYNTLEKKLRAKGFTQSISEPGNICRWKIDNVLVDVMPTDRQILGFGNKWYKDAAKYAMPISITKDIVINVINAPYFIATKFEAFKDRGKNDFYGSHDLEDIITIVDGRPTLVMEINNSPESVKKYISDSFRSLSELPVFIDCLSGHITQDREWEYRLGVVKKRIKEISDQD